MVLGIATLVYAGDEQTTRAGRPTEYFIDSRGREFSAEQVKAQFSTRPRANRPAAKSISTREIPEPARQDDYLWTLTHVDDNAEYYLGSGDSLDTFAVVFTPAAPCIVKEVYVQWYTGGNIVAYAAHYSDSARAISPDGECSDIARGAIDFSPIGEPYTAPTLNHIDQESADWSDSLDFGGEFEVGGDLYNPDPFVIVLIKQDSQTYPRADGTDDQDSLTYTWFGGPWTDNQWGRYSDQVDLEMLVKVTYPGPPWDEYVIQSMTQLPNTYRQTGPFSVYFDIFGSNGIDPDSLGNIRSHWTINGQNEQLGDIIPEAIGADGNGFYRSDINGEFSPNDVIEYWITWESGGLSSESAHLWFEIKQPTNPYADILLIADDAYQKQLDANLYGQTLSDMGLVYEFWDTQVERGIDSSVVNYGWRNIIIFGWGNETLPVLSNEISEMDPNPGYDLFLDNGNRLALIDQDWLFGHGQDEEPVFGPGDFAYDYFGLTGAVNDPVDGNNISTADTLFFGAGVTAIDSSFVNSPLYLNHTIYGTTNWADYLTPGTATPIFTGANDDHCYGVINTDGNFHTMYLSFMADAAVDTLPDGTMVNPQFTQLLNGIINWFDVVGPTTPEPIQPTAFNLLPNYPNPFNPSTQIEFTVPQIEAVSITVYNLNGQQVTQLVHNREYQPGTYSVPWNGRDATGKSVAAGTYFYKMEAGDFSQTRKMVFLK